MSRIWTWLMPGQVELDRVLGGHDVGVGLVERRDRRVERVGLARAGRPRHQHDPVGLADRVLEALERVRLEAELGHVQHQLRLVEQPHHDLLAPQRGQARDAEVEVAAAVLDLHLDLDAAVLRQALLRDVELGHDLDARDERVLQLHGQRHHVVEDAVDAEADAELLLVGLDVDVGGAALQRVDEQHVRELDDGRGVGRLAQVAEVDLVVLALDGLDVGVGVAHRVEVDLGQAADRGHVVDAQAGAVHRLLEAAAARYAVAAAAAPRGRGVAPQLQRAGRAVVALDRVLDGALGGDHRLHVVAGHELDVVHGEHVRGVGHGDREHRAGARQRQHLVLPSGLGRDDLDDRRVHLEVVEVDRGNAVLPGQQARDLLVLDEAEGHERLPELAAAHLLVIESFLKLLRSHHVLLQQQLSEFDWHSSLSSKKHVPTAI